MPLIELVLLMKNEKFTHSITNQTYLDRIHNFNLTFFLSGGDVWMKTHIIINDWVVRFNDIDDL
ncbi:MAG: FimB/Mfa2 family fimbrial subunit [Proteiniphilum sp.]|nr:FimB/Mfa2 family fimbrial subunit [Proteiniphilum sp.]